MAFWGGMMGRNQMMKQSPPAEVFGKWLENKVNTLAERILDMLAAERCGEYGGLPQELIASIFNEVLWQAVVRINFPVNALAPEENIDEELGKYVKRSQDKAHFFFSLCKQLAAWCPDDRELAVPGPSCADDVIHRTHQIDDATVTARTKH